MHVTMRITSSILSSTISSTIIIVRRHQGVRVGAERGDSEGSPRRPSYI